MLKTIGLVLLFCAGSSAALATSIGQLQLEPSARWRYQQVDDPLRGDAIANTLKVRLDAQWQFSANWDLGYQLDAVHAFNPDRYNDNVTLSAHSPIPDVKGVDHNQLWLAYRSGEYGQFKLGRQVLNLDNQRHIGSVNFWQNEQSFDALNWQWTDNDKWTLNYTYIAKVRRIFGKNADSDLSRDDIRFPAQTIRPSAQRGVHDHNSHLFNAQYQLSSQHALTGYAYLLENKTLLGFSSNTYGVRFEGAAKPGKLRYDYNLEYAQQQDSADSPWRYKTQYFQAEFGAQYRSHKLSLAIEQLGDDNGFGFTTSLGSNHQFLGWADVFSSYNAGQGLENLSLTYRGRKAKLRWRVIYHRFNSLDGGIHIGDEINAELAYRYTRDWEWRSFIAAYRPEQGLYDLPTSQENLTTWAMSVLYRF